MLTATMAAITDQTRRAWEDFIRERLSDGFSFDNVDPMVGRSEFKVKLLLAMGKAVE